jgi:TetR/AcrR family transcriptional regulator, lmrAB and yxaGH operons repressor
MKKGESARARLVDAAATLFKRQGYHGTGLTQIVSQSGAPKGSLYFHFPGGKDALALAAIEQAGSQFGANLEEVLRSNPIPRDAVWALARSLGRWMKKTEFVEGCPITTVCLELAPGNASITAATNTVFSSWQHAWEQHLCRAGFSEYLASRYSTVIVAAFEGAFVLSRAERSVRPFETVADVLAELLPEQR